MDKNRGFIIIRAALDGTIPQEPDTDLARLTARLMQETAHRIEVLNVPPHGTGFSRFLDDKYRQTMHSRLFAIQHKIANRKR
ncbi:hypothetical protein HDR63_03020 [bacterium]|nr:hypothetical protein [bacterium]